jgi:hypothetical protein
MVHVCGSRYTHADTVNGMLNWQQKSPAALLVDQEAPKNVGRNWQQQLLPNRHTAFDTCVALQ